MTPEINTAIEGSQREIKLIEEYRTTLIAHAVTGKIDVCPVHCTQRVRCTTPLPYSPPPLSPISGSISVLGQPLWTETHQVCQT